eukprot:CAMPEP_0198259340 /NCGR_PEP_ID=MMETSP1447-20131203/8574_1 /TAXON_ID=420782 /ORGANISM="Chaetoceros dichaeta, Strain CCMP1751" /LENGTH=387 /DNA_ID=CAMNT_0043946717 /DNA_START=148 /DNA_END=1311 /DNA_ORIENTATION=-
MYRKIDEWTSESNENRYGIDSTPLSRQIRIQQEFQQLIEQSQKLDNCKDARILVVNLEEEFDGFALEVRFMAYYLQIAVATERALVVSHNFTSAYAPRCNIDLESSEDSSNRGGSWACIWNPVSNCTADENIGSTAPRHMLPEPMGAGILSTDSVYFDAKFYGPERIVDVDRYIHVKRTMHVDVIPQWERMHGRYWIRAQISDYFWKYATDGLNEVVNSRLPRSLLDLNEPYIAFHIRMTDNVEHLADHFGRNATVTRSFGRFMEIADRIRRDHHTLRHIYVATDNDYAAAMTLKGDYPNWTFHIQDDVKRSDSASEFMWFQDYRAGSAGAIGADIETLRRADFLVGSFQSNIYRLAAELNTCYHTSRYLWDMKRIHTVDVEWYEDP